MLFCVGFHQPHQLRVTSGETQVFERFGIHREEAHCGAVFRSHVGDRRAVGHGKARQAGAVELDKFSYDSLLAQDLGDREHQISGRGAFRQPAVELEAHHFGDQHRERLAKHGGLRFDPADTPAENA